jgi:hypothetical protein
MGTSLKEAISIPSHDLTPTAFTRATKLRDLMLSSETWIEMIVNVFGDPNVIEK